MRGLAAALIAIIGIASFSRVAAEEDLEETSCGWVTEKVAFAAWKSGAGKPHDNMWADNPHVKREEFATRDGRVLRGYSILSLASPAQGYLLVAQGNAMLADHILEGFGDFAKLNLDVYIYDYRGYGKSDGLSRIKAIFDDYDHIIESLNNKYDHNRYLYGASFGGIVLMNAIGHGASFDAAIIDATPATVGYGCPDAYDPVRNVPANASKIWVITGTTDSVVREAEVQPLGEEVKKHSGSFIVTQFDHPMMNGTEWKERVAMFTTYLQQGEKP